MTNDHNDAHHGELQHKHHAEAAAPCCEISVGGKAAETPARERLAAIEAQIAHHHDAVCRYLTLASLVTDLGHQSDVDGMHYAVDCAQDILSQPDWPQARLLFDAGGDALEFEDDIYGAWGMAAAVGEAVLIPDMAERLRAIRALVECGIDDLAYEWGLEVAWFLRNQRHATEEDDV